MPEFRLPRRQWSAYLGLGLALAMCSALPATPQTDEDSSNTGISQLVQNCSQIMQDGGDVVPIAKEILAKSNFNLGEVNRQRAAACLKMAFNDDFEFLDGRFVSIAARIQEENNQRAKDILVREMSAQAAMQRELNERKYLNALAKSCYEELETDRFRALTNDRCAEIFIENGID